MEKPVRILQVFASLDRGGAETEIMNLYRRMDRSKVQFDFIVNQRSREYDYSTEIMSLGGKIYFLPRYRILNVLQYIKAWRLLLATHPEWKILHAHHTSCAIFFIKIAKKMKRITIVHSHTAYGDYSIKGFYKYSMRLPLRYCADYLFACSKASADFMFGRNNSKVIILKNAIDVKAYEFRDSVRKEKRIEFGVEDNYVVGHIGNFSKAKNYPFILSVFRELHISNEKAVLLLIGQHRNNPDILQRINKMGLASNVIVAGVREDVADLLNMMDIFLFPSLYEGIPVSLLEAQANGLRCIVSDRVSKEVKLTEQVEFHSLKETPKFWSERVLAYQAGYIRESHMAEFLSNGYEISNSVLWLEQFYLSLEEGGE